MSDMADEQLIQMVFELNGCLPEALTEYGCGTFGYYSNGYTSTILFSEFVLWDEDNDERPWDDEKDDYAISIKDFVIQEYNKLAKLMTETDFTGD